jgi:hypothetical protein
MDIHPYVETTVIGFLKDSFGIEVWSLDISIEHRLKKGPRDSTGLLLPASQKVRFKILFFTQRNDWKITGSACSSRNISQTPALTSSLTLVSYIRGSKIVKFTWSSSPTLTPEQLPLYFVRILIWDLRSSSIYDPHAVYGINIMSILILSKMVTT